MSMFKSETYTAFQQVLETLIQTEVLVEKIRRDLKDRKDFSASCAFTTMAYQQPQGQKTVEFITWRDLKEMLVLNGQENIEDQDAQLLIDRFDKDADGLIGINEFHELITPIY